MSANHSISLSVQFFPRLQSLSVLVARVMDVVTNSLPPSCWCVGSSDRSVWDAGLTMGERIQNVRRKCQLKITREHVKVGFEGTDIFAFDMDEFIRAGSLQTCLASSVVRS